MRITEFLAVYGAALSTLVFLWNARRSRPEIKVKLVHSFTIEDNGLKYCVNLSLQNTSTHTVYVTFAELVTPYKKMSLIGKLRRCWTLKKIAPYPGWTHHPMFFHDEDVKTELPIAIAPQNSHEILIPGDKLFRLLNEANEKIIAASVQDAVGRRYYSKPLEALRDGKLPIKMVS